MESASQDVLVMSNHKILNSISSHQLASNFHNFSPISMTVVDSSSSSVTTSKPRYLPGECRKRENMVKAKVDAVSKSSSFRIDDILDEKVNLEKRNFSLIPCDPSLSPDDSGKNQAVPSRARWKKQSEIIEATKNGNLMNNSEQDLQFGVNAILSSSKSNEFSRNGDLLMFTCSV